MINVLQQNARLVRRWTALAYRLVFLFVDRLWFLSKCLLTIMHNRLGLERQAQSIKVRVNMNCEDLDQCITYLIQDWSSVKPEDANLGNLVRALKAESFNDVAGTKTFLHVSTSLFPNCRFHSSAIREPILLMKQCQ